ncbi:Uncharacterized protein LOK49_LG10G01247 [Camellia lanceoleosa]|uniref:Uncharacterized protein n=1 Tax=Camellia lanceoleosa TaxID=1840588 RepID=A0ACC0G9J9_9ERIC|nr:Uncharacterized protein LOK49_LG10G01247 [Camellia lanceoleosa]
MMTIHSSSHQVSLSWLNLKVFYVGITKCEVDNSTPQYLTMNNIPLNPNTLLEVNGARTSTYSHCIQIWIMTSYNTWHSLGCHTSLLRRDRLDKKSEEVIFVCTDSIRVAQSVKFNVFDKDVRILSGVLGLCTNNGLWSMNCESEMDAGTRFLQGKPDTGQESDSPRIKVYVASCFDGTPIILTKTGQLSLCKKQMRTGMLDSISKYEAAKSQEDVLSRLNLQVSDYPNYKPENKDYDNLYTGTENLGGENGERSCFNAGGRLVVVEALIRNGTSNNIRIIAAFPPLDFVGNSRL